MNTPITYYGGKQKMLKHILPKIPNHVEYVEPFTGGGAVFFAKKQSKKEFLNDINGNISAFYRAMKNDFNLLNKRILETLHCEHTHEKAKEIYNSNDLLADIDRAWAVWVLSRLSFAGSLTDSF